MRSSHLLVYMLSFGLVAFLVTALFPQLSSIWVGCLVGVLGSAIAYLIDKWLEKREETK